MKIKEIVKILQEMDQESQLYLSPDEELNDIYTDLEIVEFVTYGIKEYVIYGLKDAKQEINK